MIVIADTGPFNYLSTNFWLDPELERIVRRRFSTEGKEP